MQKILIPIDIVFVPVEYADEKCDKQLCQNNYVPITVCIKKGYSIPFWRRIKFFDSNLPRLDAYDRDRLIVKNDFEIVASAKAAGKAWIFAKAEEEVIKKWKDRNPSSLKRIISKSGRTKFYNPVYLEAFRKAKTSRPIPVRLDRFRRLMGPLGTGLKGLDIGCNIGFMTHHMERLGVTMTAIDFDRQHLEVAECLTKTYGLSAHFIETQFDSFNPETVYDVVMALTVLYHIFFRQEKISKESAARKVGALTKSVLLWESGDQPEREKELLLKYGGFDCYKTLGPTQGTGLVRELGFFCKSSTATGDWLLNRYEKLGAKWIIG